MEGSEALWAIIFYGLIFFGLYSMYQVIGLWILLVIFLMIGLGISVIVAISPRF